MIYCAAVPASFRLSDSTWKIFFLSCSIPNETLYQGIDWPAGSRSIVLPRYYTANFSLVSLIALHNSIDTEMSQIMSGITITDEVTLEFRLQTCHGNFDRRTSIDASRLPRLGTSSSLHGNPCHAYRKLSVKVHRCISILLADAAHLLPSTSPLHVPARVPRDGGSCFALIRQRVFL